MFSLHRQLSFPQSLAATGELAVAAQYTFLAAQAFDYETGLLHTDQGRRFLARAVQARALGVMRNGEP